MRAADGDELFGYYEREKGVTFAEKAQAESPVVDRWNEYMKDILELVMDPETGAQPKLEPVFRLDWLVYFSYKKSTKRILMKNFPRGVPHGTFLFEISSVPSL